MLVRPATLQVQAFLTVQDTCNPSWALQFSSSRDTLVLIYVDCSDKGKVTLKALPPKLGILETPFDQGHVLDPPGEPEREGLRSHQRPQARRAPRAPPRIPAGLNWGP